MRKLYLLLVLLATHSALISQTKEYLITPDVTAKTVVKYQNAFSIYKVTSQEIDIPIYDTSYVETETYSNLKLKLDELKQDSIKREEEYLINLSDHNEFSSIITKINIFLNSNEKFKVKKINLLKAQQIADKFNVDYLIYADKSINQKHSADFFSLKLDKVALKNHLNKIKNDVPRQSVKPLKPSSFSYSQLNSTRTQLSRVEKYEQKLTQKGTTKAVGYILGNQIEDLTTISGTFKVIGDYYIMKYDYNIYIQNQLVEKEIIEENNLRKYIRYQSKSLMKDESSGVFLYGTSNFLYNCGTEVTLIRFIEKLKQLGFNVTQVGDKVFINTSNAKLLLTSDIYKSVNNGNNNYINEIANSVKQFNLLMKEAAILTDKLVNHFNAYQHATLTTDRLNQWKSELGSAQKIYDEMQGLKGRDIDNLYNYQKHINMETLEKYNDFWQVLSGSNKILGM
jgi:hypothetical protein